MIEERFVLTTKMIPKLIQVLLEQVVQSRLDGRRDAWIRNRWRSTPQPFQNGIRVGRKINGQARPVIFILKQIVLQ